MNCKEKRESQYERNAILTIVREWGKKGRIGMVSGSVMCDNTKNPRRVDSMEQEEWTGETGLEDRERVHAWGGGRPRKGPVGKR